MVVFVAGSIKIKKPDQKFLDRLDKVIEAEFDIVIGDADGADTSIQRHLVSRSAKSVVVFCTGSRPRNNLGNWPVQSVISQAAPGTRAYFTAKDIEMARVANYGLMVWDSKSTGTLSNVIELLGRGKKCLVFVHKEKDFVPVASVGGLQHLVSLMTDAARQTAELKIHLASKIHSLTDAAMNEENANDSREREQSPTNLENPDRFDLKSWISWIDNFIALASTFVGDVETEFVPSENREVASVKTALFARGLMFLEGARLLLTNDRLLEFRSHSRFVVEVAMYLALLDDDPSFLENIKSDDRHSKIARAKLHLKFAEQGASRTYLQDFIATTENALGRLELAKVLTGNQFEQFYNTFRDISADASHVSMTSLRRHALVGRHDNIASLVVNPKLEDRDLAVTVAELCSSMIVATLVVMKARTYRPYWKEFEILTKQYRTLVAHLPKTASSTLCTT